MRLRTALSYALAFSGLLLLWFPLFLVLAPYIEIGREEARAFMAYHEAKKLREEYLPFVSAADSDSNEIARALRIKTRTKLPKFDVWEHPYEIVRLDVSGGQDIRVFSCGPDGISASDGLDDDDIASDRPSLLQRFRRKRSRQWVIAFSAWGTAWAGSCVLYAWYRRRQVPVW